MTVKTTPGKLAWMTRNYNILKRAGFSEWCCREGSDQLPNKAAQRAMLMDFILKYHRSKGAMHLFSLPGSAFYLENMMAEAFTGKFTLSTCEYDRKFMSHPVIVRRIDRKIPGEGKALHSKGEILRDLVEIMHDREAQPLPTHLYKMIQEDDLFTAKVGERTNSIHVNCGADDLLLRLKESKAPKLTAVWYDGMGRMDGAPFLDFVAGLAAVISCGAPIVITLLKGREGAGFLDDYDESESASHRRVLALEDLFFDAGLRLVVKKTWDNPSNSAKSKRGNPMINFAGVIKRIRPAS